MTDQAAEILKIQKNNIKGDQDIGPQDEDDEKEEKVNLKVLVPHFKDEDKKNPKEITPKIKKDHKARFLTQIGGGGNGNVNSDAETKNLEKKADKAKSINGHPYRSLIFSPSVTESTLKKHLSITYRGLVYSVKCLKGPSDKYIKTKQVSLVESKGDI